MKRDGFTLVEMMIALLLLGIGLLGLAQVLVGSLKANFALNTVNVGGSLAQQKLEQMRAVSFTSPQLVVGGSLDGNLPGYFDQLDSRGQPPTASSPAFYHRRWQIADTSASLKTITVRVVALSGLGGTPPTVTYSTVRSAVP